MSDLVMQITFVNDCISCVILVPVTSTLVKQRSLYRHTLFPSIALVHINLVTKRRPYFLVLAYEFPAVSSVIIKKGYVGGYIYPEYFTLLDR